MEKASLVCSEPTGRQEFLDSVGAAELTVSCLVTMTGGQQPGGLGDGRLKGRTNPGGQPGGGSLSSSLASVFPSVK